MVPSLLFGPNKYTNPVPPPGLVANLMFQLCTLYCCKIGKMDIRICLKKVSNECRSSKETSKTASASARQMHPRAAATIKSLHSAFSECSHLHCNSSPQIGSSGPDDLGVDTRASVPQKNIQRNISLKRNVLSQVYDIIVSWLEY